MARPEDDFIAEDQTLETQDKKEVKSLPDDADEGNFDEVVAKDPELSASFPCIEKRGVTVRMYTGRISTNMWAIREGYDGGN